MNVLKDPQEACMSRNTSRGWVLVLAVAMALAIVSWVSKVPTEAQVAGDADGWLTLRLTIRKLANSGTIWAGLGITCGWLVRRPLPAAAAGIFGSLFSLTAHYALGQVFGTFDATIWAEKRSWFVAALVFGAPLGLVGAMARRTDAVGLGARLVIPLGAILEPIVLGMLTVSNEWPDPVRISSIASGLILLVLGLVGGAQALRSHGKQSHPPVGSSGPRALHR